MRSWSISVGRIFGVDLRIHWTFFLLPLFVWYTEYASHRTANDGRGLALVGIIFACVLVHEFGHALMARRLGIRAKSIILLPIGGVTQLDDSQPAAEATLAPWKRDIRIAMAGPLANLLLACALRPHHSWRSFPMPTSGPGLSCAPAIFPAAWCGPISISPGFNLLPAYPMDGGRVLRALFSRHMDPVQATRRAVSIGQAFATMFILGGMLLPNYWLTLVGLFLFIASQMEERSAVFQSVLEKVHLEDIMLTDFATLSPADTLEDALEKAVHCLQDDFPVIRGSDMVGVISKQKILEALRAEGNGYVQAVMNRIFDVAQKGESLASAFRKLTTKNLSIIPVVEDQRLVGIVTLQNLMHSMTLLAESRKLRKQALNS